MNCSLVRRLLSAYFDAELPAERRGAVRRHLQSCDACRSRLDGFKQLAGLFERLSDLASPTSLWEALAPRIRAACESATPARAEQNAFLPEPTERRTNARFTFKPLVEGLEDRQALSAVVYAGAIALTPPPVAWTAAFVPAAEDWGTSSDYGADFGDGGAMAGAFCGAAV